ncbi:MAG TPA: ABC transporter permease subunit [Gemmataceae bacterium]|jgi:ABC-type transport system involved in multi-copper enzyme maturation permease subunit|nr:ABC transporter permease subunit [Gemmataceae bacterium]
MSSALSLVGFGIVLVLVQVVAALPWVAVLNWDLIKRAFATDPVLFFKFALPVLALGAVAGLISPFFNLDPSSMAIWGGIYGATLHAQLTVDFFVLVFAVLLPVWPKGAAVGLAAFREGVRQPMFWLFVVAGLVSMLAMPFLPYFTFGEDFKMVKDLGYATIMLCAGAFGVLNASTSISEEIEGRTAITLMSKPVSRRQFLIGKFVGIVLACLVMTGILSWFFDGMLLFKLKYDSEPLSVPDWLMGVRPQWDAALGESPAAYLWGAVWWFSHVIAYLPGVILGFSQAMVLVAIAVALATRLPMIVNVVCCAVVFFLGNLTPVLEQVSQHRYALVRFMAQLFDNLLPSLDFFNLGASIARDTPPPAQEFAVYIGSVSLYAVLYTAIALLFGLILFEDRDLA